MDLAQLIEALDANPSGRALLITPNQRMAAAINNAWGQKHEANTWLPPSVIALPHWLQQSWDNLQNAAASGTQKAILPPWQEEALWEAIIAKSDHASGLLRPLSLAKAAMEASRNLALWQITDNHLASYLEALNTHSGLKALLDWEKDFNETLNPLQCTRPVDTQLRVLEGFQHNELSAIESIYLYGFDDIAPLHKAIIENAAESLHWLTEPEGAPTTPDSGSQNKVSTQAYPDTTEEYKAAASWALGIVSQQPDVKIGIICSQMASDRSKLERILNDTFEPHYKHPSTPRYTAPYNFSAGIPLGSTPLIADALSCLNLLLPAQSTDDYCRWLQSPFWAISSHEIRDAETENDPIERQPLNELSIRVRIEELLRKQQRHELRSAEFRYFCEKASTELGQVLQTLEDRRRHHPNTAFPSQWATLFSEHLDSLNWPGTRSLDSIEHQQQQQWQNLLEQFAAGDLSQQSYTLPQALRLLQRLCMTTHFQAEQPETPVNVLGPLEAAGLSFTHIWVTGMNAHQWPAAAAPNPLLPPELQKTHNMPHASAEKELAYAKTLLAQYQQNGDDIIFSWSKADGERELAISPLIAELPIHPQVQAQATDQNKTQTRETNTQANSCQLEIIQDVQAPAISAAEPTRGGASLLQQQAINPFNAFAIYRLGATSSPEPVSYLSAAQRGELLHHCYELFWKTVKDQSTLLALSEEQLAAQCDAAINQALSEAKRQRPATFSETFVDIEWIRLRQLMLRWLEQEKERAPFTVTGLEERTSINIHQLTLNLRIDRIDQLQDGSLWFIDYKTGNPKSHKVITSERLLEPQLPLYAQANHQADIKSASCSGIGFAFVGAKKQGWLGIAKQNPNQLKDIKLPEDINPTWDWDSLNQQWQQEIGALAEEFMQGIATNCYYHTSETNYTAELFPLNRYYEQEQLLQYLNDQAGLPSNTTATEGKPQ
ncbi:MAG: PD-(D/E)XK nuclease family protein [Cellvibrionaceae bacterium]